MAENDKDLPINKPEEYLLPPQKDLANKMAFFLSVPAAVLMGITTFIVLVIGGFGLAANAMHAIGVITGVFTVIFSGIAVQQKRISDALNDYTDYGKALLRSPRESIEALSRISGSSTSKAAWELAYLTQKGFFLQGHFSQDKKEFMLSDAIYEEYQKAQLREAELLSSRREAAKRLEALDPDVQDLLTQVNSYAELLRNAEIASKGNDVKKKFHDLANLIEKIFEEIKEHPEKTEKVSTLKSYYLPATSKLFASYIDMQDNTDEQSQKAKAETEDFLDSLQEAYQTIYSSLFTEEAIDISSDISVLKTMLKQDGLVQDDFQKHKK